jgi:sugar/nucleoside kinase (ribokinase family)
MGKLDAMVFGNVTLDVICYPVNDVPRYESLAFETSSISPGGCASNVAMGLASLGVPTGLVASTGVDDAGNILDSHWQRAGVDTRFVQRTAEISTAVSVGLVDDDFQPRFVHTPGANKLLTADALDPQTLVSSGARFLHVGGFFVLTHLLDDRLAEKLARAKELGMKTSLDVVYNFRMDDPSIRASLWKAMPYIDYFLCNGKEAARMVDENNPQRAASTLKARGAANVIIKLGKKGCLVEGDSASEVIPAPKVDVLDTTGAGDAFAAGLIAALTRGADIQNACQAGNQAGAHVATRLGPIQAWIDK